MKKTTKTMSEYLLDGYLDNTLKLIQTTEDTKERERLAIISKMLRNMQYTVACVSYDDTFLRELDPNTTIDGMQIMVYLFDTERNMFWKSGKRGYTDHISEAGMYPLKFAQELIEVEVKVNRNNTKMVLFEL